VGHGKIYLRIIDLMNIFNLYLSLPSPSFSLLWKRRFQKNHRHRRASFGTFRMRPSMDGMECLGPWSRRVLLPPDWGGSPERLHRPNRFRVWLHRFQGESGVSSCCQVSSCLPHRGPYEASKGMYPGHGQRKTGGRASIPQNF
jgi:hypothetical protein